MGDRGRPLVVGIDVGTNATKCLVCDAEGNVVAQSRRQYLLSHPQESWTEQDPEDLWGAVVGSLRDAVAAASPLGQIIALSLASQGGTTIVVDAQDRPLRPAISWLDTRAEEEQRELAATLGREYVYRTSGWELGSGLALLHVPWLAKHEPATYESAARYLFVNDFVLGRLCGERAMDPSDASLTMLYNVEAGDWDQRLCEAAGVCQGQLSPIRDSGAPLGRVLCSVAAETGLPAGTLVVNGAHDQYCAALGAGVVAPGEVLLSCGTAWVVLSVSPALVRDPQRAFSPGRHAVPGAWGVLCSMPAAGAAMDWVVRNLVSGAADDRPRYDLLDEQLRDVEPGAGGLLFLPYFTGVEVASRRSGVWGSLTGLALGHSRWDVTQALMEGVALELRWILERLATLGAPARLLHMVGGATHSSVWPSIVADVTSLPLNLPAVAEGAARGAAALAAAGAGLYDSVRQVAEAWRQGGRRVEPRPERVGRYAELYRRYRALDAALRTRVEAELGGAAAPG